MGEIEKVKNDMKLFLTQFEIECGIWDEAFYFFINKFQKQINEEFLKIY